MRNRAKCKLCSSVIESFMQNDYVSCKCGNISVNHGLAMFCSAIDWSNFLRLGEQDEEIEVTYKEKKAEVKDDTDNKEPAHKPTKEELISMLDEMIKSYENLPKQALLAPVTHSDHVSVLMLISSLFKSI